MKIAPSILSADFSRMGEELKQIEKAGADWIHIDVMDGHFVPSLTFGAPLIANWRKHTNLPFDVHLMISNPAKYLKEYTDAGADIITVHFEAISNNPAKTLETIKALGIKVGISIKPETSAQEIGHLFEYLDLILVMSVEPGKGGQNFMVEQMDKVNKLHDWIKQSGKNIRLSVDGGINVNTIALAKHAGADTFVAGSAIFKGNDYAANITALRKATQ